MPEVRFSRVLDSLVGELLLVGNGHALVGVYFSPHRAIPDDVSRAEPERGSLDAAAAQLDAYFAGRLMAFDLPLAAKGTEFRSSHNTNDSVHANIQKS